MKHVVVFVCAIFVASNVVAQDWAKERVKLSPRHSEYVDIKSGNRTIWLRVVYPESKSKTPAVLVIHEIFGLTDWVKSLCDQLAENGVIAVCPDLLSGNEYANDADSARKAIAALPQEQIKADLNAAADYALKIPACNGTLAVCGFCWGGGWAFEYAHINSKLKAAYSFYGVAVDNADDAKKIACPVYGFYAENDERVDATIPKAEELMKAAGKKYEPVIYKGAGHGFMREGESPTGTSENKRARDEAWARWKELLKQL